MSRSKGSKNKNSNIRPVTTNLSIEERIKLIANLIVDRIMFEQKQNHKLFKELRL